MRLQRQRFSEARDVRTIPRGRIDVVELDDTVVGRMTYEPGWRWSVDIQPIAGTDTCQYHHLGVTLSGRLRAQMPDGTELEIGPGDLFEIPPFPGDGEFSWQRFKDVYWSKFPGNYFAGDGVKVDEEGYFWLLGRVDDIMLVAGHNISTMEVESALVDHPKVAEAAVVGRSHEIKGQAVAAFVTVKEGVQANEGLMIELKEHVAKKIGAIAKPDDVIFTADLPKTRSGKIMRRLLRDIAEGKTLGDTTTLADPNVIAKLKEQYAEEH